MKKRKTIYSRIVRMVVIVDCMMIFLLFCGYTTVGNVIASDHPEEYFKNYKIFCIAVIIVFALVLTLIFQRIMKTIRVGFRQITEATRDMASGKIDIDIPLDGTDEFGDLFREYKLLIDASREQALLAEEVANEDLTKEIVPRSDEDVLGKALQKMVYENNNSLGKIRDSVQIVYDKTNEVSAASNNLAQGSTEQASAIEEITASIAEVNQDTKNNAEDANTAEELIETALNNVISGSDKMNSMMKAIKDINTSSENISKIIKTIDDIAFQTNILALNAAVEAARAGEAGRGFAVVAEEVRNLAAKSAEAASETAELIESSIKITDVGTQIAGETSEMFEKITSNVKSTAEIVSKIAQASKNQVTTLEQIDIAIDQVSQVIQNNSSIAEVCADASSDLANRSNEMQQLIMKYKLNV